MHIAPLFVLMMSKSPEEFQAAARVLMLSYSPSMKASHSRTLSALSAQQGIAQLREEMKVAADKEAKKYREELKGKIIGLGANGNESTKEDDDLLMVVNDRLLCSSYKLIEAKESSAALEGVILELKSRNELEDGLKCKDEYLNKIINEIVGVLKIMRFKKRNEYLKLEEFDQFKALKKELINLSKLDQIVHEKELKHSSAD